jgi:hypothetical protein
MNSVNSRAYTSVRFYHLNHTDIVEQRKVLCADIRRQVANADRYFKKYDAGDCTAREAFENTVADLGGRLAAGAPYSATARAILMGMRGTYTFVDVVLSSVR